MSTSYRETGKKLISKISHNTCLKENVYWVDQVNVEGIIMLGAVVALSV